MGQGKLDRGTFADAPAVFGLGAIFSLVLCGLIAVVLLSTTALSGVRAYVAGEGLWSKGQKEAAQALLRFAATRDDREWKRYERDIGVPLADRRAREALLAHPVDIAAARAGFLGGGNHPDDVDRLILLFRYGQAAPSMAKAVRIWAAADLEVDSLRSAAASLRDAVLAGADLQDIDAIVELIVERDRRLTILEEDFSAALGLGARWIEGLVVVIVIVAAIPLLLIGVLLSAWLFARLRRTEGRYRDLLAGARDAIFICDALGARILEANRSAESLIGKPATGWSGVSLASLHPPDEREAVQRAVAGAQELPADAAMHLVRHDGRLVPVEVRISRIEAGRDYIVQASYRDESARRAAEAALRQREEELRQSQKLEAVGRLAGGVAHDFNNLLTAILGYSSILMSRFPSGHAAHADSEQVLKAAQRAAGLTRQLLAFSRRQVLDPRVLDPGDLVREMESMMRRLVGEDIQFLSLCDPHTPAVRADRTQLEQVLVNLIVNARDAMPSGGLITIELGSVTAPGARVPAALEPGTWVRLIVRDNGSGMDSRTREHLFEPFFTTKELGHGTGLGLSTVLGVVKQSGGHIEVESELGKGTTFHLYLPAVPSEVGGPPVVVTPVLNLPQRQCVLVAEDDDVVRELACTALEQAGFEVLVARDGAEAYRVALGSHRRIELLITDVIMPHRSGRLLADSLARNDAQLRVLFMSGFTDQDVMQRTGLAPGEQFLPKPFLPSQLVDHSHAALAAPAYRPAREGDAAAQA